jgi:hypothetical protein
MEQGKIDSPEWMIIEIWRALPASQIASAKKLKATSKGGLRFILLKDECSPHWTIFATFSATDRNARE